MDIEVEEGNVDVGNTAEPSYEVVASSNCSAQVHTNDTDGHELDIESEDSKVSVGNAAKQSHDVVGVGIDCIFNPVKVSTEADLGPQLDVILLTSLDVPNESSQALSAYIHCIRDEEHLLHREGGKVFLENTFISSLIKRDGDPKVLLNCKEDTIEKRVDNYLQCDMVDLKLISFLIYLKGLERQIKLAAEQRELYQGKWSNLDVASWPIIEKITTEMQTDGKHWVQSTKPYLISLSLQKLKDILDVNKPMDTDCFNMAVRMIACNDALFLLEDKYHYMDLQFCSITKFGRDPHLRAKPDINMLAKLLECWPDMEYDVSDSKQILLPYSFLGHFTLYVLNKDTRSIYIMDSMLIPSWFKGDHPSMHYIHNIHYIANNVNAAMELANPTWKDDIYMWRRIVPTWVPRTLNWDLSDFLVINFKHDWNGIRLPCICTNGNVLKTKFLVELLKYKDNESKDNIPEEIQEIIRHIRYI
ncbi:hypothetical protein Zm00014a_037562 [Zea mays]|nr:hypothetical protein Zm00014a_037562 [Zea mays]